MKKITILVLAQILLCVSCKSDDSDTSISNISKQENENRSLVLEDLESGVIFPNSKIIRDRTFPVPTGDISISLDSNLYTAYQSVGFDFSITAITIGEYAGAYVQIIDSDGDASANYIDVKYDEQFDPSGFQQAPFKTFNFFGDSQLSVVDDLFETGKQVKDDFFNVNFSKKIQAGKFCFIISCYDNNGNVSSPEEICINVKEWSGSDVVIGDWVFEKQEFFDNDELQNTVLLGGEDCTDLLFSLDSNCDTEGIVSIRRTELCDLIRNFEVSFDQDGTYKYLYSGGIDIFDDEKSNLNCEAVTNLIDYQISATGNWTEEGNELRAFIMNFEETIGGNNSVTELDEGILGISGNISKPNDNNLILTQNNITKFSEFNPGQPSQIRELKSTYKLYFKRK